ncbi:hypothetical protein [Wenzhouxiangella sediminis]|uniref:Uncharacterized protein n=1 Tax=Wenzhouxiangella sediminis TaxID=1792836 RepID=A0A3E1K6I6_9GAMM|nr:hypothetical protein [Wenzhouxiangella sediminis]RFF29640.1 hypothetical protein DZC52_11115 [Wenzhouxiangella sediminis]
MLLPLLMCWMVYAPLLIVLKFYIPWEQYDFAESSVIVFCAILVLSIIFSWSAFVLLELIRQIESGERPRIALAIAKSIKNTILALPIAVAWAVIWFLLSLLEALFSRASHDEGEELTAESAARTVAGYESFSLSGAFFQALKKGVRMAAFLIYPAVAWEGLGTSKSIKKGLGVAKTHKAEFATGFVLTELAALVVFLPPAVLFLLSGKFGISFPDWVWFSTMVYCAFAWSFSLFLEQMFVAELYLWHMIWEKESCLAKREGRPEPALGDVKRPSVRDDVDDLLLAGSSNSADKPGKK